jgi:hypothetical protein
MRARRWLYLPADKGGAFLLSNAEGGTEDIYKEEIEFPSFGFPAEGRNGLWNGMAAWSLPWKEVLAAP